MSHLMIHHDRQSCGAAITQPEGANRNFYSGSSSSNSSSRSNLNKDLTSTNRLMNNNLANQVNAAGTSSAYCGPSFRLQQYSLKRAHQHINQLLESLEDQDQTKSRDGRAQYLRVRQEICQQFDSIQASTATNGIAAPHLSPASRSFHNHHHHHHHQRSVSGGGVGKIKEPTAAAADGDHHSCGLPLDRKKLHQYDGQVQREKQEKQQQRLTATETSAEVLRHQRCPSRHRRKSASVSSTDSDCASDTSSSSAYSTSSAGAATANTQGMRHCCISSQTTIAIRLNDRLQAEKKKSPATGMSPRLSVTRATYRRLSSGGEAAGGGCGDHDEAEEVAAKEDQLDPAARWHPQFHLSAATWAAADRKPAGGCSGNGAGRKPPGELGSIVAQRSRSMIAPTSNPQPKLQQQPHPRPKLPFLRLNHRSRQQLAASEAPSTAGTSTVTATATASTSTSTGASSLIDPLAQSIPTQQNRQNNSSTSTVTSSQRTSDSPPQQTAPAVASLVVPAQLRQPARSRRHHQQQRRLQHQLRRQQRPRRRPAPQAAVAIATASASAYLPSDSFSRQTTRRQPPSRQLVLCRTASNCCCCAAVRDRPSHWRIVTASKCPIPPKPLASAVSFIFGESIDAGFGYAAFGSPIVASVAVSVIARQGRRVRQQPLLGRATFAIHQQLGHNCESAVNAESKQRNLLLQHHRSDCGLLERLSVTARLSGRGDCVDDDQYGGCGGGGGSALLLKLFYPEDLLLLHTAAEDAGVDMSSPASTSDQAIWSIIPPALLHGGATKFAAGVVAKGASGELVTTSTLPSCSDEDEDAIELVEQRGQLDKEADKDVWDSDDVDLIDQNSADYESDEDYSSSGY